MTRKRSDPTQRPTPEKRAAIYQRFVDDQRATLPSGRVLTLDATGVWHDETGHRVCGVKTRDGYPCPTNKVTAQGNGRCRMHGRNALSGPQSPAWKGGYSRALAGRPKLRDAYERFLESPDPISLRDDITLLSAQIEQLLDGATVGSAAALPEALAAFEMALAMKDPLRIKGTFDGLKAAVSGAVDEEKVWKRVLELQRNKGRLARAEHMHVIANATMVDAASAWALVHALTELIKTHVAEPTARRAIADGIVRLVGRGQTEEAAK